MKPICKAERWGKDERDESGFVCQSRVFVKYIKNSMTRARRRFGKQLEKV